MDRERVLQYVMIALAVIVALVGSFFGVRLPYPELPIAPEAVDLSGIEARLETVEGNMDALLLGGGAGAIESFSAGASKTNVAWLVASQITGKNLIESQGDLTVADDVTITDDAAVGGDLTVTGALAAGSLTGFVTSTVDSLTVNGNALITGTLIYGADSLYPLGVGLSGFQIGFGSVTVTGTVTATHTTGTPYTVHCTLETWSIDTAFCVALGTTGVVTATVYDITGTEATTAVDINWLIIGMP